MNSSCQGFDNYRYNKLKKGKIPSCIGDRAMSNGDGITEGVDSDKLQICQGPDAYKKSLWVTMFSSKGEVRGCCSAILRWQK